MLEVKNLTVDEVEFWSKNESNNGGMRLSWSANIGFGTTDIVLTPTGIYIDTETMGKEFVMQVLAEMIKNAETDCEEG